MECTVRWMGNDAGMSFVAETGSGHAVVMDGAPKLEGATLACALWKWCSPAPAVARLSMWCSY